MTTEHDAHAAMTLHAQSACQAQACSQGRKRCPCPQACGIAEPDHEPSDWGLRTLAWAALLVCAVWAVGAIATNPAALEIVYALVSMNT
jgi:hypothetical protein